MNKLIVILIILFTFSVGGCAFDVIHVKQIPVNLESGNYCDNSFVLSTNADATPSGGYKRTLKQGTRWNCIGRIAQGNVYATKDQILTIEASNVFEAYIVISSKKLVGFYLPVEHTYSPLENPIPLVIDELTQQPK